MSPDTPAPLLGQSDDGYEYRACVHDTGDLVGDFEGPFATENEALAAVKQMIEAADPPWDDGWIERRICTDWERMTS